MERGVYCLGRVRLIPEGGYVFLVMFTDVVALLVVALQTLMPLRLRDPTCFFGIQCI